MPDVVVTGMMRSGTTWMAQTIADALGIYVEHEPIALVEMSQEQKPPERMPADLIALIGSGKTALWRYYDSISSARTELVKKILLRTEEVYGTGGVWKVLRLPYWQILRSLWPHCKIVHMIRNRATWLASVARTPDIYAMFGAKEWVPKQPWGPRYLQLAEQFPDLNQTLLHAAAYHEVNERRWLDLLRSDLPDGDYLVVDYDLAVSCPMLKIPRVLTYASAPNRRWLQMPTPHISTRLFDPRVCPLSAVEAVCEAIGEHLR